MNSAKFWKNIEFLFYFLNYGKRGKMDAKREEKFFLWKRRKMIGKRGKMDGPRGGDRTTEGDNKTTK